MALRNIRTYIKFLSRNKLYTFVSIFGFSASLMFVILLGLYVKQELFVDGFHENKDRIVLMTRGYSASFANSVAPYVKDRCPEVESFCRVHSREVNVGEKGREKLRSQCMFADSTFFSTFSFKLREGDSNQVLIAQRSVVLTQAYASKVFGNESALGKTLTIDNVEHTVTGIMEKIPQNTQFPQADFIASYSSITNYWGDEVLTVHNNFGFSIYFLEKKGADLSAKTQFLLNEFKKDLWLYKLGFDDKLEFVSLEDVYFKVKDSGYLNLKSNSKSLISIYIAIVLLILVIATLNYINMTVAQSGFRGKEAAIKKLLGSSKKNIIYQLLGESLIMSIFTFGLGLFLAFLFEPFFNNVLTTKLELAKEFTLPVISVAIAFILLLTLLSGLIPALVISGFNPLEVVKGSFTRKVKTTYSKGLIIFQYTVAIALLICTFFIKQQSDFLINHDLGYNHDRIFTMGVHLDTVQAGGFKNKLLSMPGIEAASLSCGTPMDRGNNNSFDKDGQQYSTQVMLVDDDFFKIYGITSDPPNIPFTEKSLLINKNLYNSPLTDPQNMTIDLGYKERLQITGILSDFYIGTLNISSDHIQYIRISKMSQSIMPWSISVKIDNNSNMFSVADKIQKEYISYTGGELPKEPQFANDTIQEWYKREQKLSKILSAFTLLTVIISIMGVFAMSMYLIKQKEREIGLRKVNGATESQILVMLNGSSLIRVIISFAIACPIAYYAISKWLEDFPHRIELNWWTFVLSGLAIALLTLFSVSYMTWRAAKANPVETLKSE